MDSRALMELIDEALQQDNTLRAAMRADMEACYVRDPACDAYSTPLLYYKGFHALQAYRVTHWLWGQGRKTLALLQEADDVEVSVIPYRTQGFTRDKLEQLFRDAGLSPREALRTRGSPAEELGLLDNAADEKILNAMVEHPILVERPFVETDKGVRLCRPQEKVREIL